MSVTLDIRAVYDRATASMPVAPEAPPPYSGAPAVPAPRGHSGSALISAPAGNGPVVTMAACASGAAAELDWVPDGGEAAAVPEGMRQVCLSCPGRLDCLLMAVFHDSEGYWAATTTADRRQMVEEGTVGLARANGLQASLRAQPAKAEAEALHAEGEGSLRRYRAKCRCGECRRSNADQRAKERAGRKAALGQAS